MNLFDFLMSNVFILVVIAGFIFNIITKYREQSKPERKSSPPLRRKTAEIDVRSEVEEAKRFQKQAASIQAKLEEAKAISRTEPLVQERKPAASPVPPVPVLSPIRRERRRAPSLSFSKKQAVQGVIWSEILGPPKAKRK
jgi:hypothetical protein